MLYFDTAASFPLLKEVESTLQRALVETFANSSSSHVPGEAANNRINQARELLADSIGANPSEIIFTSGATESNNIALKSLLLHPDFPVNKRHIVSSTIEHKCVLSVLAFMTNNGWEVSYVKPGEDGIIALENVKKAMREDTALVSIMHVNNELGTINPIHKIGEFCYSQEVLFHTDAAQSYNKVPIDVDEQNIDLLSLTAHKIGGPKGIGAVYIRDLRHQKIEPVIHGAGQEFGVRGGTVAVPLIEGFKTAIECFPKHYQAFTQKQLKRYFYAELERLGIQYCINGNDNTLPHCTSVSFQNIDVGLFIRANENTLSLAQGSACSAKEIEPSHVLSALGLTRNQADNTLRLSFTLDCTRAHIDELLSKLQECKQ